jgi:hypothetical protein
VTPEPTPDDLGSGVSDPAYWPVYVGPAASAEPSAPADEPEPTSDPVTVPDGLQVIEPLPSQDLLDAIVGGVAGTYFGH